MKAKFDIHLSSMNPTTLTEKNAFSLLKIGEIKKEEKKRQSTWLVNDTRFASKRYGSTVLCK